MRTRKIGTFDFRGSVDITDPCYNRNVQCRMNDLQIADGTYDCFIKESDEGEWGIRVAEIGIRLPGQKTNRKCTENIGAVAVDAGMAGFFHHKPDYTDDEWEAFCDSADDMLVTGERALITKDGFFSLSGYGDGYYPVYVRRNEDGEITAVRIRFIE